MPTVDTQPYLPDDDSAVYEGRRKVLNRIDQEWTCDQIIGRQFTGDRTWGPEYCGLPEHDPFTNRCWDHTPGNIPHGGP